MAFLISCQSRLYVSDVIVHSYIYGHIYIYTTYITYTAYIAYIVCIETKLYAQLMMHYIKMTI